ncbi:hypothetical protein L6452_24230 [Arctium lappa]|uniref:Uncharacterized protein n=1 Tax=Arctium lappa TaxID=4217 RepID=A0ACB9AAA4_ARCLA|nr:hypothetical protein L6452_24230 [Arctium lappa]
MDSTIVRQVEIINTQMQRLLEPHDDDNSSSCIFRVPQSLLQINKEAYQPQIVSIGPYHHGKDLPMIEKHKWRYLYRLQKRMLSKTDEPLKLLLYRIMSMEKRIRESYSESILYSSEDLAKMMLLDGVFLIVLFLKFRKRYLQKDPIFKMVWVLPFLMRDFLMIENQIPFFVLEDLFYASRTKDDSLTLQTLILEFFNYGALRPKKVLSKYVDLKGKHLLDFFRKSFLVKKRYASIGNGPYRQFSECACLKRKHFLNLFLKRDLKETVESPRYETPDDDNSVVSISTEDYDETPVSFALTRKKETSDDDTSFERIQPATKLVVAGLKFKKNHEAKSFLDIKFQNGVLSIPHINLDDFYTHFILNGIIFEQCYSNCSKDITTYIVFLGCLINTSMDVGLLSDSKIIHNYLGTDKELVKFFNNVGKYVAFDIDDNYLKNVFREINEYCDNGWHVGWAGFKHTYFDSPWTFISAFAAFVLLCLAGLQTFYTVYPYYYERI